MPPLWHLGDWGIYWEEDTEEPLHSFKRLSSSKDSIVPTPDRIQGEDDDVVVGVVSKGAYRKFGSVEKIQGGKYSP